MIITVTKVEKDKSYFDRAVKFACSKESYVNYALSVGSVYDVKDLGNGLVASPSSRNKVR